MKKYSFPFIIIALVLFALSIMQCTSSPKDKTLEETNAAITTDIIEPKVETETLYTDTVAITEPGVVLVPSTTTKSKVDTKASSTKKPAVTIKTSEPEPTIAATKAPATIVAPETKETNVVVIMSEPKSEPKPVVVTKAPPALVSADFTLKSVKAVVIGTSSLHAWESQITKIEGKGSFQVRDSKIVAIKAMEVKIAVEGIKSKEGKKMDNKTYETFNSDNNPFIIYSFSDTQVKIDASNAVTIDASGKLSMAGTTQPIRLMAKGNVQPNGDLKLSVSQKLKMTEFNMKPPVMLLGTIKVGDEITVEFDLILTTVKSLN